MIYLCAFGKRTNDAKVLRRGVGVCGCIYMRVHFSYSHTLNSIDSMASERKKRTHSMLNITLVESSFLFRLKVGSFHQYYNFSLCYAIVFHFLNMGSTREKKSMNRLKKKLIDILKNVHFEHARYGASRSLRCFR